MEHNVVEIDDIQVSEMSKRFADRAGLLKTISDEIGVTLSVLQASRFCGHVGDTVMTKYNAEFIERFQQLEKKLTEISVDLADTVKAYTESDETVKGYFETDGPMPA